MRSRAPSRSLQHSLLFTRLDIWRSIPADDRQCCRELCEHLLQAVLERRQESHSEVSHEREDPARAP